MSEPLSHEALIARAAEIIVNGGYIECDTATYSAILATSERVAELAGVRIVANTKCPPGTAYALSQRVTGGRVEIFPIIYSER